MGKVTFNFKFPDLAKKILKNQKKIQIFLAAQMQFNRGMLFDHEGAYNGHDKWAPLKFRSGQILSRRGTLRRSLAPIGATGRSPSDGYVTFKGDTITIGTNLYYAALMNYGTTRMPGGVMKATNAKALKIPAPENSKEKFIFRKSVKIPERSFITLNNQDKEEFQIALRNKIKEILESDK